MNTCRNGTTLLFLKKGKCGSYFGTVPKLLYAIEKGEIPVTLNTFDQAERDYIYQELKSVMDVYEGAVCDISPPHTI